MAGHTIGMWMYQNAGGEAIQRQIVAKLRERDILTVTGLNLRDARARNGQLICHDVVLEDLSLFFSYNAGEQSRYQVYLYQVIDQSIPTINNFRAFELTEDKFLTSHLLRRHGIVTPDYWLLHKADNEILKTAIRQWDGRVVYKPTGGWGGAGLVKIEGEAVLDMLLPFIRLTNDNHVYIERFVDYDNTDFRVDIVNGQVVGCYGRRAAKGDWKTNITSGGQVFPRELPDDVKALACRAAAICGLEIAGVDLIYDREHEQYIVLEVNGIPAFATPEQEEQGLNFNSRKIDAIVALIDDIVNQRQPKAQPADQLRPVPHQISEAHEYA